MVWFKPTLKLGSLLVVRDEQGRYYVGMGNRVRRLTKPIQASAITLRRRRR
jgi:hypothetical protein